MEKKAIWFHQKVECIVSIYKKESVNELLERMNWNKNVENVRNKSELMMKQK